jgi:hypothetical protein
MYQILVALLFACLILVGLGTKFGSDRARTDPVPFKELKDGGAISDVKIVRGGEDRRMGKREEIRRLLEKLAAKPAVDPKTLIKGAMCYAPMMPNTSTFAFVCSKCGAKTNCFGDEIASIDEARRLCEEIRSRGLEVKLDESLYCAKCNPRNDHRGLLLEAYVDGPGASPVVNEVAALDLRMIVALLDGKDRATTHGPDGISLKENLSRLEKLLGVRVK